MYLIFFYVVYILSLRYYDDIVQHLLYIIKVVSYCPSIISCVLVILEYCLLQMKARQKKLNRSSIGFL